MKDVITPPHTQHLYPYRWSLEDAVFTKDKGKVFSCFACGGGSTMGYKIAGYDVIGCNEIDPRMMKCYETNHHPQYSYLEDIRDLVKRNNLPEELYCRITQAYAPSFHGFSWYPIGSILAYCATHSP